MSEFDLKKVLTHEGYLRMFESLINLIGAIFCFASIADYFSQGKFFEFVGMAGLVINLLIMAMEIANISSKIKQMIYLEIVYDAIWILFYLIAANIIIKFVKYDGIVGVSVFCG